MKPRLLTTEHLVLIDAIARCGSFAAAAQELGRVPSAVTYAVRRLEESLDVLLFDRRERRARLTPAGEELLGQGRQLLAANEELSRRVRQVASGWEAELRLALDTLLPFELLLAPLQEFLSTAPTRVKVSHEVLGGTWDALVSGRADLAIGAALERPEASRHGAGLKSLAIGSIDFVFAVAPAHPLAALAEPIGEAELRCYRQVVAGDTSQRLTPRTTGLLGAETLVVPSMEAKIAAQRAGLGVGFLPVTRIRADLQSGALIAKRTDVDKPAAPLQLAWHASHRGRALDWWMERLSCAEWRAAATA